MKKGAGTRERNCSPVEHNWSTIDSRRFEPEIRDGGLSSENHPQVIEKNGGSIEKNCSTIEHN